MRKEYGMCLLKSTLTAQPPQHLVTSLRAQIFGLVADLSRPQKPTDQCIWSGPFESTFAVLQAGIVVGKQASSTAERLCALPYLPNLCVSDTFSELAGCDFPVDEDVQLATAWHTDPEPESTALNCFEDYTVGFCVLQASRLDVRACLCAVFACNLNGNLTTCIC